MSLGILLYPFKQRNASASNSANEKKKKNGRNHVYFACYLTRLQCAASIVTLPGTKSDIPNHVKGDIPIRSTQTLSLHPKNRNANLQDEEFDHAHHTIQN